MDSGLRRWLEERRVGADAAALDDEGRQPRFRNSRENTIFRVLSDDVMTSLRPAFEFSADGIKDIERFRKFSGGLILAHCKTAFAYHENP